MAKKAEAGWVRGREKGILPALPDEALDDRWNRFKVDPVEYIDSNHFLEYPEPQSDWRWGCPLGNGDMGALAYGPPEATMFCLGKTDLWDYSTFGESNFFKGNFQMLRDVLERKDEKGFRRLRAGNGRKWRKDAPTGKPGGMLRLELFPSAIASKFRQHLSYSNAEVVQTWVPKGDRHHSIYKGPKQTVTMTSFIHAARNVLAVKIETEKDVPWLEPVLLSLFRGKDPKMSAPSYHAEGKTCWYRQNLPGGEHFIVMLGTDSNEMKFSKAAERLFGRGIPGKSALTLYLTIVTSRDTKKPLALAKKNIADARKAGFEKLRTSHRKWWHGFWRRGYVVTPWKKVEDKWYYTLYLKASTCRPGRMSPGLQGNWIKEHYPAWNADFHNNINMQIVYWGQYTANRLELGEPFYKLFYDILPRCKKDTKKFFKMRGARYPISCGPDGAETAPGVLLNTWVGAGGWLALHFWWHYLYSQDKEFLRRYAYPVIRECALFYEDFLQDDADGTLYAFPTVHMEMSINIMDSAGKNGIWDLPVIIRTFKMAIEASAELGVNEKDRKRWEDILERIAPLPTTEEGGWKEFSDKPFYNIKIWDWSLFMPIFPMELVGADSGPEHLQREAQNTIEHHYRIRGEKAHEVGGFSGAQLAAALLRMGHAERGLRMAEYVSQRLNPSGLVANRESFYLQVDTPLGLDVFLNEMLLQSYDGVIRLFPAAPACEKDVRFHSLRAQGGFLVSAERRDNRVMYALVKSLHGNTLRMRNPFVTEDVPGEQVKVYKLDKDTVITEQWQHKAGDAERSPLILDRFYSRGDLIEFPTEKGAVYLISKEVPWICNVPVVEVQAGSAEK